jgi:hypothetical protein
VLHYYRGTQLRNSVQNLVKTAPYFKKEEGLGVYTLLQVCGRLKCPLVHIVIGNDVPAYIVKYVRTHVHTYVSTYLGMVGYVVKYVRTHEHTHVSTY